jgi:hypothetical protein
MHLFTDQGLSFLSSSEHISTKPAFKRVASMGGDAVVTGIVQGEEMGG